MCILFTGCGSGTQKNNQFHTPAFPSVDSLISHEIDLDHIPGAVIRIQQGDSILHRKAYGFVKKYDYGMKLLENPEAMTVNTMFDLASLTKVCGTTFGIMMLVDQGKIRLNDPIYRWFPEFNTGKKKYITVRNLLTHTAGLYQWYPLYYRASDKKERHQIIARMALKWSVGEGRHYSDLGFMLLGDIIEKISGQPLNTYLHERLYEPLGMEHTMFNPLSHGIRHSAIAATSQGNPFEKHMVYDDSFGYTVDVKPESWGDWRSYTLQGEVNDGNAWYANSGVSGHAGLFSTVDDLQTLVRLLLDDGIYKGRQLISKAVIDTFLTKDRFDNGLGWAMDLDFISAEGTPPGTFGHTGFTGTNIVVIPIYDLSIILLTNRQNVGPRENGYYYNLAPLRQSIVDAILEKIK